MIKSKLQSLGFWIMLIMTSLMLLLILMAFSQILFDFPTLKITIPKNREKISHFIIPSIGLLIFGSQLWRDAKLITIDTFNKSIIFTNFFTRKQSIYSFDDFDGFVDMYQKSNTGPYRVIYLVKEKRFIKKISSFYYSNLNEMQEALKPIKYLGEQNYNILDSIKVLFNQQVID